MDSELEDIADRFEEHAASITYKELKKTCEKLLGEGRQKGTSHTIFKTGLPPPYHLVNLQAGKGTSAKPYQVRQVAKILRALAKQRPITPTVSPGPKRTRNS